MKKLDLDVLGMLVAVADSGSFIAGAEQAHRSPSALSMQIRALETALESRCSLVPRVRWS